MVSGRTVLYTWLDTHDELYCIASQNSDSLPRITAPCAMARINMTLASHEQIHITQTMEVAFTSDVSSSRVLA